MTEELCALLSHKVKKIGDAQVIIQPGKGHRFVVILRGPGLEGPLTDADPNREGAPMPVAGAVNPKSAKQKKTAELVAEFYKKALPVIAGKHPANGFLLRGIAHQPDIPLFEERYRLKPACLAVYPMYKGLAQLVGMTKIEGPQTIAEQFQRYLAEYDNYDYFFIHYKYTDMYGEDGNFRGEEKSHRRFRRGAADAPAKAARSAGHHRRPFHAVRGQGPLVASAAGAAGLAAVRLGQAGAVHGDGGEPRLAGGVRGQISDPPDAGQRADV